MRLAKGSQVSGWELEVLEQCRQRGIKNLDQLPMQEQHQPQNQRNYQQSYEVTPPVPTKVEHKVVTNVNLDKQAQLRLILNASFLSGGGIGLLLYVIKGSVMMGIAYGVLATGIISIIIIAWVVLNADRYSDNAVEMLRKREEQRTERERIAHHAAIERERLHLASVQAERATEQARERRQRQYQQRQQLSYHNRTISETSIVATENTIHYDCSPFEDDYHDDDYVDVQYDVAPTTDITPVSDVLKPTVNDGREIFLNWLSTVHSARCWNDEGRIVPSMTKSNVKTPWGARSKSVKKAYRDEMNQFIDSQHQADYWLIRRVDNGVKINMELMESHYADIHEYVVNNWP